MLIPFSQLRGVVCKVNHERLWQPFRLTRECGCEALQLAAGGGLCTYRSLLISESPIKRMSSRGGGEEGGEGGEGREGREGENIYPADIKAVKSTQGIA